MRRVVLERRRRWRRAAKSATNPFGLAKSSSVEAVIFNGGYGYDYVKFAADQVTKQKDFSGVTIKVSPSTQIAQQLQPRFVGGNPPDLIDNSGENAIGFSAIEQQLETLDDVFEANNYEGTKISDTLYPNVKLPGTFDGKFIAMNYVMTVYGIWYSASLFQQNGWTPPKTWDDAMALGAKAKAKGKYLWVWGKEAATYYQTMAVNSAIKEGGDEVRLALENLKPNCWSLPQIQGVFKALGEMVQKGYFVPGGAGTQFTAAQAKWSNDEQAILYPSGGWIENEMKDATKTGFEMTGAPEPTVSSSPTMPYAALRAAAGEPFIVPSQGEERRRRQGDPARDAVEGSRDQLLQDPSRADDRQGPGAGQRVRVDRAGLADEDAGRRRQQHLQLPVRRLLRHEHRPAGALELVPVRPDRRGRAHQGLCRTSPTRSPTTRR